MNDYLQEGSVLRDVAQKLKICEYESINSG